MAGSLSEPYGQSRWAKSASFPVRTALTPTQSTPTQPRLHGGRCPLPLALLLLLLLLALLLLLPPPLALLLLLLLLLPPLALLLLLLLLLLLPPPLALALPLLLLLLLQAPTVYLSLMSDISRPLVALPHAPPQIRPRKSPRMYAGGSSFGPSSFFAAAVSARTLWSRVAVVASCAACIASVAGSGRRRTTTTPSRCRRPQPLLRPLRGGAARARR
jgi:hypothetical protein